MRITSTVLGGNFTWIRPNWQDYKIEHPAVVRHVKRLQEIGLKDPWVRNYVWVYSPRIYKTPWQPTVVLILTFWVTCVLLFFVSARSGLSCTLHLRCFDACIEGPKMPTEILKKTLLNVVFKVASHVGFELASVEAADILSEILFKYMQSISKSVADLAFEDEYFSVIDGLTILELMNEPLPDLVKYVRESGSYFPKPPIMYIPLAGRTELNIPFLKEKTLLVPSNSLLREPLCSKDGAELLTENKVESTNGQTSATMQGRNDRKLPLWAGKVKYKLTCVTYDPSLGSVVERNIPPPVTPSISSTSLSPPRISRKSGSTTSPLVSLNASDVILTDATPTLPSSHPKSTCSPSNAGKSRVSRRNSQTRKKRFGFGRRRFQSIGKRTAQPLKPSVSPAIEIAKVTKAADHRTPDDKEVNGAAPILADPPSRCTLEFMTAVGIPDTVALDDAHPSDVHATSLSTHCSPALSPKPLTTSMPDQSSLLGGSGALGSPLRIPDDTVSFLKQSRPTPQISETLAQAALGPAERRVETPSMASSSNNVCMKSEDLYSPTSSDSCTEPLTNEELSRDYEVPRFFNFPPTRRSSFSPSSSSPSSSSPSTSSSSSTVTDSSKAAVFSVPPAVTSTLRVPSQLPIQQPSSDHSSRASSSLPGSLAPRQTNPVTGYVAEPTEVPHTAAATAGGGIRIKIRLGGPDGETMSVRSSEPAFTNTNSSSSTSSSSVSSPLSSAQVSDEETTARRHSAIPPALVVKGKRHEPASSFGPLTSKPQLRAPSMSQQPSFSVKTPKLVIKFGGHEHGSTSIVRPLDQQVLRLKPAFAHEKLRGSSISSMESSSSSSTSQTSDDEDEAPVSRPPHLPVLERLPSARTGNRSSQPPALSLLKDPSSKVTSSTSECKKLPPQLRPLHIIPSLTPVLKPSVATSNTTAYSPAPSFGQCSNKSSSKREKKGSRKRYTSQSPPKLGLCHSACGKRVLVDSVFSDDEEEDAIASTGDSLSMRSRDSRRSHEHGRHESKRRRFEGDRAKTSSQITPPTTQIIAASAGTSYYFNNAGEQIWLCPICRTEDDGNLMVGCDSCDDWYHSSCLGLSKEPESAQWFCPKCLRERREQSAANSSYAKKRPRKSVGSRHCRR
ncbi:Transcription initiation factor TFIID subunit 3 [Taenia crassiceps]|uniref:Transcription initiation factor TFIID subunit 3 n=1 Tax=Taenia crassiceps TaxID=6207 RepID=A0ABR4QPA4_9CEST